jgi:hypothetical protein
MLIEFRVAMGRTCRKIQKKSQFAGLFLCQMVGILVGTAVFSPKRKQRPKMLLQVSAYLKTLAGARFDRYRRFLGGTCRVGVTFDKTRSKVG